jgi:methylase of polypeptide subunit release factors
MTIAPQSISADQAPTPPDPDALGALLRGLKQRGYRFVTPTPATHARVVARPGKREARDLRDVFGWSLPFAEHLLDDEIRSALDAAGGLMRLGDGRFGSRYRVSSLGSDLFVHSAYPTQSEDSVFFGPDSYRFANLIEQELSRYRPRPGARLVDIGAGAGVGGIVAAKLCAEVELVMTDINPAALSLACINARAAGVDAAFVLGSNLDGVDGLIDLAVANPPYMMDTAEREYRDGGDMRGARAAFDMAAAATGRLSRNGRLILYTGSAIVDGHDQLHAALRDLAEREGCALRYREIDPDVFGEELEKEPYREVERIAVVGAIVTREG